MHRNHLRALLERYAASGSADDPDCIARFRSFVADHDDCLSRRCIPGHVTASCWILDHRRERFLLTHHRKLDRWLQLGGHADGDPDPLRVALREAQEESGMQSFSLVETREGVACLDLDIHEIPARRDEPAHIHHDVRYLLIAAPDQPLVRCEEESKDLRWFAPPALETLTTDDSVRRLARKSRALLASPHRVVPLS